MSAAKPPKCPACGSPPRRYVEMWTDHSMVFAADDTGKPEEEGDLCAGVPSGRIEATCGVCGKAWWLRGSLQITDVAARFDALGKDGATR